MVDVKKLRELLAQIADYCQHERADEPPYCSNHPDAPHGFDRNASHSEIRYVCDCERWSPDPALNWWIAAQCTNFIRVYGPELLAIAEASEWQPIETAPKDGTRILALLRLEYSDGTAGETQTVIYWYGGGLFWVVPIPMNYVQGLDSDVAPTHWMPLPKPPERVREVERE